MVTVPLVICGCALGAAFVSLVVARLRMPKQLRSTKAAMRIALPCLVAHHENCDDHLQCPCKCHDMIIHTAIATRWEDLLRPETEKRGL